jgi:uroporphyrinogen-III synthase
MSAFCVISTKKLRENQRRLLLNNQVSVIDADFIQTREISANITSLTRHIIFTSQKSAGIIIAKNILNPQHQILCVGQQTAAVLTSAGLNVVETSDYAAELASVIRSKYTGAKFTFFSGTSRMDTLPTELEGTGIQFTEFPVYETISTPVQITTKADGIMFFSPSAVKSYLLKNSLGDIPCFCIGTTTAAALKSHHGPVIIATRPSIENVIVQAIKYYNINKS